MSPWTKATVATAGVLALTLSFHVGPSRADQAACRAEIQKLCPDTKPGDGKYGQCVTDQQRSLSEGCKSYAKSAVAREKTLKQFPSCLDDAEKFCPNTKPSLTELMLCLRTHQGDLSEQCKHEISGVTGK